MNYTGPKVRLSRRLGVALTPKASRVMEKKAYPPGLHGQKRRISKLSDYGKQLLEKQRLRANYNITEKQLRNYFAKAVSRTGNTSDNLIQFLETRLDAFVLRAGFAPTIYAARQLVSHRHFIVNGRITNIPSYRVRPGDVIQLKEKSRNLPVVIEAIEAAIIPAYVEVDQKDMSASLKEVPHLEDVGTVCNMQSVVEFYSR